MASFCLARGIAAELNIAYVLVCLCACVCTQVESLAQVGVQLLLFHLGRELSFAKLKAVWSVALVGGALQIVSISALGGVVAAVLESPVTQVSGGGWYCCIHVYPVRHALFCAGCGPCQHLCVAFTAR
jgi:hypothetical protein